MRVLVVVVLGWFMFSASARGVVYRCCRNWCLVVLGLARAHRVPHTDAEGTEEGCELAPTAVRREGLVSFRLTFVDLAVSLAA